MVIHTASDFHVDISIFGDLGGKVVLLYKVVGEVGVLWVTTHVYQIRPTMARPPPERENAPPSTPLVSFMTPMGRCKNIMPTMISKILNIPIKFYGPNLGFELKDVSI